MASCRDKRPEGMQSKHKRKKIKLMESCAEETRRPRKTPRVESSEAGTQKFTDDVDVNSKVEERQNHPWSNLELILYLKSKEIDTQRKLELAYNFIKVRAEGSCHDDGRDCETVKTSRLLVFLNDWIQHLLISSGKKTKLGEKSDSNVIPDCLEPRCWEIFRFCLEKSSLLHILLNFLRDLLHPIRLIARHALCSLNCASLVLNDSCLSSEGLELYKNLSDCLVLMFSSHRGMSNENLELWIPTIEAVLELVNKILIEKNKGRKVDVLVQLSCLLLEPFCKFLRGHPMRKGGFAEFIDKLLEQFLELMGLAHLLIDESNKRWLSNLLKIVEDILSHGLFHPTHMDGFLNLHITDKYLELQDRKTKTSTVIVKSYHRHLFDGLERIMDGKNFMALDGIGGLFLVLIDKAKKHTAKAPPPEVMKGSTGTEQPEDDTGVEKSHCLVNLDAETRKSLFDFFVQITKPLLEKINCYAEEGVNAGHLEDIHCKLNCLRTILCCFACKKVYIKTEDNSGGACLGFLKKCFDILISLSVKLNGNWLFKCDDLVGPQMENLLAVSEKLIIALGSLLEIEYDVTDNNLTNLWSLMISFLALAIYLGESIDCGLLLRNILNLSCQLVNMYSELRQVSNITFALCKALRLLGTPGNTDKTSHVLLPGNSSHEIYVRSVGMLLCSQEFRHALHNSIKSVPEGQSSGCIRQLVEDVSESFKWLKMEYSEFDGAGSDEFERRCQVFMYMNLQFEILGRGLSEIYNIMLYSLNVTGSNSTLIGSSVKDVMAVIRPGLSKLVDLPSQSMNEFFLCLTGSYSQEKVSTNHETSIHWALVFFFSLYMSCRSLFRQTIGLMPPDLAQKMSASMGDLLTAYPGKDLVEKADWKDEGYFSWILVPSASLLDVIQSISSIYHQNDVSDSSCLIYQLHGMALQRLVDLNRMIKSAQYTLQSAVYMLQPEGLDDRGHHDKKCRKWERYISKLKKEALGLTKFILRCLRLLADDPSFSTNSDLGFTFGSPYESDEWEFSISSLNRRTFYTAIWWIIGRNIDVWCSHAEKKDLKRFLWLLLHSSLPSTAAGPSNIPNSKIFSQPQSVTSQKISYKLLRDSTLYDHRFVRRHLASTLCKTLEKLSAALFPDASSRDINFRALPNWTEVLVELEESLEISRMRKFDTHSIKSNFHSDDPSMDDPNEDLTSRNSTICQNLLGFLCWMPKGHLDLRSLNLYITYVLNIERLIVSHMSNYQDGSKAYNHYKALKLFLCCRKTLKYLFDELCYENAGTGVLSEGSFPFLWLFKSAYMVLGFQDAQAADDYNQYTDMAFSLMDHTSYIFRVYSDYYFGQSLLALIDAKGSGSKTELGDANANSDSTQTTSYLAYNDSEAWDGMFVIAQCIKKETQAVHGFLEDVHDNKKINLGNKHLYSSKLSYLVSCLSGYFWGLTSALNQIGEKDGGSKLISLISKRGFVYKLNTFIKIYSEVLRPQLCILIDGSDKLDYLGNLSGAEYFSHDNGTSVTDVCGQGRLLKGIIKTCLESPAFGHDSLIANVNPNGSEVEVVCSIPSTSVEFHSVGIHILNKHLLRRIVSGDERDAGFMLRHLYISYSALLRLNLQVGADCLSPSVMCIFMAISQFLMMELVNSSKAPEPFVFIALDGCLMYLEEIGSCFPSTDPSLSRNIYTRLIELHLMAIGKCISLQGKKYSLISHEIESSTKFLQSCKGSNESSSLHSSFCLDEMNARLRKSFEIFIRKSSELHLLSGVQAIERALVGVQIGSTANFDVYTGKAGGGMVSSYVAAGIDCLDLLLENVTGRRCLNVVRRHIQSLLAGLFNIILHLQSPLAFCERSTKNNSVKDPDPGSVILMCIEVLTRISGKSALFQMDSWHVAQSIRIPASLFKDFSQLELFRKNPDCDHEATVHRFSINMYSACCRLLHTVLKHHKSESEKCIAQFQDSVSVLLHTLETVNSDSISRKNCFSWNVGDGIKCACSLRRIYEEMRQQKDAFGPHCFKLLANYIWVYSGFGPLKCGIKREINEALRPGIYALVDACSPDDLQYLHTVFGEGPCRSTLATLQHDYSLNFQYEGKV
ncbi:hypothetical protein SAY86_023830 [Trapa natans]|uniref:Nucleolar 27S pre-rRNA processing Urb2/Npa2 C-terminal domain-containing protein n=1 Tax=Trapa natans TaxID=22666 RepID=A0AAN7LVL5_TRANT|nr:hypothetical protein SAY86_023830 [Trapa natans]